MCACNTYNMRFALFFSSDENPLYNGPYGQATGGSVYGDIGWYLAVLGQYKLLLFGTGSI